MMVELLFPKKIRLVPPPSNTTLPPVPDPLVPVMKMETLDGTVISLVMDMGELQFNVMLPPEVTADCKAVFVQVAPLRVTVAPLTGDGLLREPFAGQAEEEAEAVAWLLLLAAPMTASDTGSGGLSSRARRGHRRPRSMLHVDQARTPAPG